MKLNHQTNNPAFINAEGKKRVEGPDKVTGKGIYTGDLDLHGLDTDMLFHAVVVTSTVTGNITGFELDEAKKVTGLQCILTHENASRLKSVSTISKTELDFVLPLQNNTIYYVGQPVAIVVASELQQAQQAADLIKVLYKENPNALYSFKDNLDKAEEVKKVGAGTKANEKRGEPEKFNNSSAVKIDVEYNLAPAHHNTMEPAATVAIWSTDGTLTVHNSTQFVYGDAMILGQAFNLGFKDKFARIISQVAFGMELTTKVRVTAPLVGGGFGSKGENSNLILTALAAKEFVGKAVKLTLTRKQTFSMMPYRGASWQRIRIGADNQGKISALIHDAIIQGSKTGGFFESVGENTSKLYAVENCLVTHKVVKLDVNAPGWMRAPGAAPGMFGLECAMDELAHQINCDPVDLRRINYSDIEGDTGRPWSSKSLKQCYDVGAERIKWHKRLQQPGTLIENDCYIGYGMASSMHLNKHFPAVVRIILNEEGVVVQTSAQEIGQGTLTAITNIAAEELTIPFELIKVEFGDTNLPYGSMTSGSSSTSSIGLAIKATAKKIIADMKELARSDKKSPLHGVSEKHILMTNGELHYEHDPSKREHYTAIVQRQKNKTITKMSSSSLSLMKSKYGSSGFGAQFVKVSVHRVTGEIKVLEMVGVFACGKIINPTTAKSQLMGGMVWGLGHALMEETVIDTTYGKWINSSLAEALVPVQRDVPKMDVVMLYEDDSKGNQLGTKGVGEIGIVGVASAIANAIFNATGRRIRKLPIKLDSNLQI